MMEKTTQAWSAGWMVPFLLIFLRDGDSYGQELVGRVADFGFDEARPVEVYRLLRDMEEEGLIFSDEGAQRWFPQRKYAITESGEAYLDFWADSLEQYQEEIDSFFRLYSGRRW